MPSTTFRRLTTVVPSRISIVPDGTRPLFGRDRHERDRRDEQEPARDRQPGRRGHLLDDDGHRRRLRAGHGVVTGEPGDHVVGCPPGGRREPQGRRAALQRSPCRARCPRRRTRTDPVTGTSAVTVAVSVTRDDEPNTWLDGDGRQRGGRRRDARLDGERERHRGAARARHERERVRARARVRRDGHRDVGVAAGDGRRADGRRRRAGRPGWCSAASRGSSGPAWSPGTPACHRP